MNGDEWLIFVLIASNIANVIFLCWALALSKDNDRLRRECYSRAQFNWRQMKQWNQRN